MVEAAYRIKIVKGDQQLEVEGDKDFVLQMVNRFEQTKGQPLQPTTPEAPSQPTAPSESAEVSTKSLSVGEFLRRTGFKKHTERVLAFGYYLEKHAGMSDFTPADINACYYDAKMDSSNTSQMIIHNIRRGRMMEAKSTEAKGRKKYTLTNDGLEAVESALAQSAS
jgi:hypothetical protein